MHRSSDVHNHIVCYTALVLVVDVRDGISQFLEYPGNSFALLQKHFSLEVRLWQNHMGLFIKIFAKFQ
jgi:hypothetical protein